MLIKDMILNEIKLQLYSLVRQLEMLENEWFHPAIVEYYELCMMVSWCVFSYILSQRISIIQNYTKIIIAHIIIYWQPSSITTTQLLLF